MFSSLKDFRERVNLRLYDSKESVLSVFKYLSLLVSVLGVSSIVYYYGFQHTPQQEQNIFKFVEFTFFFYVLHYVLKFVYDFHPKSFFRQTWIEAVIFFVLLVEGISKNLFGVLILQKIFSAMGLSNLQDISIVFVQVYLVLAVIIDFSNSNSKYWKKINLHPSAIFTLTFVLLILIGSGLLMLPEMTTQKGSMSVLDALFTSTSATCVTGLSLYDVATHFTQKGQFVILILIKLGGLNVVAFSTFLAIFSKLGFGVKHHQVIEGFVNKDSLFSSKGVFGKILMLTLIIEVLGALALYALWARTLPFESLFDGLFFSFFHSISAFNNAGFSIITDGYMSVYIRYSYYIHITTAILIILGSMGLPAFQELFSIKHMRERLRHPWRKLSLNTKIPLYTTLFLVVSGSILFFLLETNGVVYSGLSFGEKMVVSIFNTITTRTAGFNTIDFAQLSMPAILVVMIFMFIGASPGSTGGGIKTSTFFVVVTSTIATLTGRNLEISKRTIAQEVVKKAHTVFLFAAGFIFVGTLFLLVTEHKVIEKEGFTLTQVLFEEISAFCTVGLSMGLTPHLTFGGKIVVILSMFFGRIGTLTVAYLFTKDLGKLNYKYPTAPVAVG